MKLHLGCGIKRLPGFVHIDVRPETKPDIVSLAQSLPTISNNSVQEIYYCHGIEHLRYAEVQPALREWRRVLIPGGVLRLAVPDFVALVDIYENAYNGATLKSIRYAINGGQEYPDNIHYSVWDFFTLQDELIKAGFNEVKRYDAGQWIRGMFGEGCNYRDWSVGRIARSLISLNVTARKPL
jgi:predicted SAM-dependent methyltransferase